MVALFTNCYFGMEMITGMGITTFEVEFNWHAAIVFKMKAFLSVVADSKCFLPKCASYRPHPADSSWRPRLGQTILVMHITVLTNLC